jgi:molybdate transport system substrate-binding protein
MRRIFLLSIFLTACGPGVFSVPAPQPELHVAAAANLSSIFGELAAEEQKVTGVRLIPSFGATALLTQQIEAGAPFDLFLAADSEHPAALAAAGLADSPREYVRGRVVIWAPKRPDIQKLEDLARDDVKVIGIANPDLAPYGKASVEALRASHLWDRVQPKVVYAQNISAAQSYADTGNADVALTAFSLVAAKHPNAPLVPANLHQPIVQSMCLLKRTSQGPAVGKTMDFLLSAGGRRIFERNGYTTP